MSRRTISLKSRVRYDGRARNIDRRSGRDAELEKLPHPLWYTVGQILRSKISKPIFADKKAKPTAAKKP